MNKRILFVPLDDRPCTLRLPVKMAQMAGFELIHPPVNLLGRFMAPGKCDEIFKWLDTVDGTFDGTIICADMPLYGGLVASRLPRPGLEEIVERLESLQEILDRNRSRLGPVYLSASLLRTAPTYTDESMIPVIEDIIQYSMEKYHLDKGHKSSDKNLKRLEKEIPSEYLRQYLDTRLRNFLVHMKMQELMEEGLADYLLIGIDDSRTAGMNLLEVEDLKANIQSRDLINRIRIVPGTDESACLLLARMICRLTGISPAVKVVWSCEEGKKVVPRYEDRSYEEIVSLHMDVALCRTEEDTPRADFIYYVHLPQNSQKEAAAQKFQIFRKSPMAQTADHISHYVHQGIPVALADVYYANGADRFLMETLAGRINLMELHGYAAWNTAGNAIGTALSYGVLLSAGLKLAKTPAEKLQCAAAHLSLLAERLADDWFYQADVRQMASMTALIKKVSIFHLDNHLSFFSKMVQENLKEKIQDYFENYVKDTPVRCADGSAYQVGSPGKVQISLPWGRLFEAEIKMDLDISPV